MRRLELEVLPWKCQTQLSMRELQFVLIWNCSIRSITKRSSWITNCIIHLVQCSLACFFSPWFMFIASLRYPHMNIFILAFCIWAKLFFFCMSVHRKIVGLGPNPKWNCHNSNIIFQMLKRQFCGLPKTKPNQQPYECISLRQTNVLFPVFSL